MMEFDDTLTNRLSGKEAVAQRVKTRLKHTTVSIPYYTRGINIFEFTYGTKENAIRMGLRDMGAAVTLNTDRSRVQVYGISIDVSNVI